MPLLFLFLLIICSVALGTLFREGSTLTDQIVNALRWTLKDQNSCVAEYL